ncbi:MAG: hypothetical protein KatS3mg129_1917 [Leptospiraceae bacterium]|nr:MAG: hypothetical protein KatS3mg129_1917 [Leptospiraceae bacterium]
MDLFRNLVILFILMNNLNLFSCPQLSTFYDILKKADKSFRNQQYNKTIYYYKQIENCEMFYNTEKYIYQYALSILKVCYKEKPCLKPLKKAEQLMLKSIDLLKPESFFKRELSERYFTLGIIYVKLNECNLAKKSFYKSYKLVPNENAKYNYENLKLICKN